MSDEGEVLTFRTIPGWPEYECSDRGDIRRLHAACGATVGKYLKWQIMNIGYAKVSLCRDAKRKEYLVHRLVVMTFIGDIPPGMDVCHFDGNKLNNALSNLRIDTRKGNCSDNIRLGRTPRGQKCGSNKYDAAFILRVRELSANGVRDCDIAREMNITPQYVNNIIKKRVWGWL
ncbi:HNH endonuclease signature motif containing protein [Paraburkholderia tropica]|uniref:HNH endonuclease signature motif containing protein n=1 Tax=Paraburkholderia tropica TaxID=92647 RepID=UPI003D2D7302